MQSLHHRRAFITRGVESSSTPRVLKELPALIGELVTQLSQRHCELNAGEGTVSTPAHLFVCCPLTIYGAIRKHP